MGNCCSSPGGEEGDGADNSYELQNYDPVRYLSDQRIIRDPNRSVVNVHFVAQTVLKSGGNHWTMYLQTSPNESVRINMDPSDLLGAQSPGHGYRGHMDIIHRDHAITRNRQVAVTIPAIQGHPVAHFIDAIINVGNHEYDFTTEGRGCTGWMLDQYHLFVQLGLIQPGFDDIETAMNQQWIKGQPTNVRPATHGFYMRETRGGGWSRGRGGGGGDGGDSRRRSNRRRR